MSFLVQLHSQDEQLLRTVLQLHLKYSTHKKLSSDYLALLSSHQRQLILQTCKHVTVTSDSTTIPVAMLLELPQIFNTLVTFDRAIQRTKKSNELEKHLRQFKDLGAIVATSEEDDAAFRYLFSKIVGVDEQQIKQQEEQKTIMDINAATCVDPALFEAMQHAVKTTRINYQHRVTPLQYVEKLLARKKQ